MISQEQADAEYNKMLAEKEWDAKYNHFTRIINAPVRYKDKRFTDFIADTKEKEAVLSEVKEYCENFDSYYRSGKSLFLLGKVGTGKTLMAYIIAHELISKNVKTKIYRVIDLVKLIRDTWAKDSEKTEKQQMDYLESLNLLVIDEVGVQSGTDNEKQILYDILDRRYNAMRPNVLIGNLKRSDLEAQLGTRVFDRLVEGGEKTIVFNWESHRRVK